MIAEYKAEGISHCEGLEWQDRLKKSYPMKSASKEWAEMKDDGTAGVTAKPIKKVPAKSAKRREK